MNCCFYVGDKMAKKIIKIKAGRNIKLNNYGFLCIPKINKLWTIYDEDEMWNHYQFNPDRSEERRVGKECL